MPPTVSPEQRRAAKRQMIEQIEQGASVQQAMSQSVVPMHRARCHHRPSRTASLQ
jgi:type II secretory pathway component PulF